MNKKQLEERDLLVEDYKRRFDDILYINFSEKKGTTAVILHNKAVGVVKPCSKDEAVDVRVGILEAYIKAKKNSEKAECTIQSSLPFNFLGGLSHSGTFSLQGMSATALLRNMEIQDEYR